MEIRQATLADSAGIAKIQVDSYRTAYAGILPAAYLEHFTYEEQAQDWRDWLSAKPQLLYVAVAESQEVIGYALGQHSADELAPYESELVALHVGKRFQGKGIGRRLFAAVSEELAAHGRRSLFLWMLADNPARGFYEKLGGKYVGEKAWQNNAYFGTKISEVAYGWLDIKELFAADRR